MRVGAVRIGRLGLGLRITETTVESVPYIAGIETGWGQVLGNLADAVAKSPHTTKAPTKGRSQS